MDMRLLRVPPIFTQNGTQEREIISGCPTLQYSLITFLGLSTFHSEHRTTNNKSSSDPLNSKPSSGSSRCQPQEAGVLQAIDSSIGVPKTPILLLDRSGQNILNADIPSDAYPGYADLVRDQKRLFIASYDHEVMAPNRQQTFMTPARQKSRVYFLWDFT